MRNLIALAMLLLSNIRTAPIKAEEFTKFFKDFSTYCLEGVGSPLHYKEMAKLENCMALPEKLKHLLKNQNGDDFDGWAYKREKGNVCAIAF